MTEQQHYLGTISTVGYLVGAKLDDGPLDCEDRDRVHVWLVVPAWATRRAMCVPGTDFLMAWWEHRGIDAGDQQSLLIPALSPCLRIFVNQLVGKHFRLRIELPAYEPEPGERVEISEISVATMSRAFAEKLGLDLSTVELREEGEEDDGPEATHVALEYR